MGKVLYKGLTGRINNMNKKAGSLVKRYVSLLLAGAVGITAGGVNAAALHGDSAGAQLLFDKTAAGAAEDVTVSGIKEVPDMILQYDEPASDWESEALPIGNGNIGAMVFGGVEREHLQVNESTVWSGGPGANANYDGGTNSLSADSVHEALQNVRQTLQDMVNDFAENKAAHKDDNGNIVSYDYQDLTNDNSFMTELNKLKGIKNNFGTYQSLGDIEIYDTDNPGSNYSDYKRMTNISNAVNTVSYTVGGTSYMREYYVNNPSNVLVCRLTAEGGGKLNRVISLSSEHSKKNVYTEDGNTIIMEGRPNDQREDGLKFAQVIRVINEGGDIKAEGNNGIRVNGADSVVIIMSAGTNYKSDPSENYDYFDDEAPIIAVRKCVDDAVEKGYDALYEEHVADYKKLFDRCVVNIGIHEIPDMMTDDLLAGYNKSNSEEEDRYLETLFFQYGRYLLISSSRENSKVPANLQGIWAQGLSPMWNSDYHTNINLQMNYWPAEQTNLSECHKVVFDYINDMVEKGKVTAKKYYCKQDGGEVRGWVIHHENNIWGNTAPSDWTTAFYFPAAAAWQCQDMWEAYRFTSDKSILDRYYDTMLEAALFWVDNLWTDERDGTLVSNPSYSPEHGCFTVGCISDHAIIWELFDEVEKAAAILGKAGDPEIAEISAAKAKLYMPEADTLGGQFREWKDETKMEITNSDNHRHQNQLYVLHPGTYVICGRSEADDKLADAARITLEKRGDGGTGWSKAWKINMWARLRDGDHAKKLLSEQLSGSTLKNLFDTHPPFQIDGNFGATAGIAEMLLQSQGDYIEPLAALPEDWSEGSYSGLVARGNFEVSAEWSDSVAKDIILKSRGGNVCALKYDNISRYNIVDITNGVRITPAVIDNDAISFPTTAGSVYKITTQSIDAYIRTIPDNGNSGTGNNGSGNGVNTGTGTGNNGSSNGNGTGIVTGPTVGNGSTVVDNTVSTTGSADSSDKVSDKAASSKTKLNTPKIKSIKKSGKKTVKVTLAKKIKGADGYVIRYSLKKSMKKAKSLVIKGAKTLKKTISGLKRGKKYYIQACAYKKENGGKTYGSWSSKKKVILS